MMDAKTIELLAACGWSPASAKLCVSDFTPQKPFEESSKTSSSEKIDFKARIYSNSPLKSPSITRVTQTLNHRLMTPIKKDVSIHDVEVIDLTDQLENKMVFTNRIKMVENNENIHPNKIENSNLYRQRPLTVDHNAIDEIKQKIINAAKLDSKLPNGWSLFQHQKDAIEACIRYERSILSLDMGLGKTICCLKWAKAITDVVSNTITIVVAPCTLNEVWKREAESINFQCISLLRWKSAKPLDLSKPVLIIASWAKIPELSDILHSNAPSNLKYLFIGDEAHAMQSLSSQRTQAAMKLCLNIRCIGCVLSTGTPMKNGKPANLLPLLIAIRHPIAKNKIEYEKRYCDAKKTPFCPWDTNGAINLEELKSKVENRIIRKTKEECLDLPPLVRTYHQIQPSDVFLERYNEIVTSMKRSPQNQYMKANFKVSSNHLELLAELRQLVSLAKVNGTVDLTCSKLLQRRDPIVIFVWFKETSEQICRGLQSRGVRAVSFTGDLKFEERQVYVDEFQEGQIDALICTYGVGSTGLTLTRSHTVILVDRPWTPGDVLQAEDRIRRIGQKSSTVDSIWITAFDMDTKLDRLIQDKDNRSQTVLSNGSTTKRFFEKHIAKSAQPKSSIDSFFGISEDDAEDESKSNTTKSNSSMKDLFQQIINS